MIRMVVGIVVVATLVGALMPTRRASQSVETNTAAPRAEPWFGEESSSASSSANRGWGSGSASSNSSVSGSSEVRLTRRSNGHFYADVDVNGTSVEFMIDTGATIIAMTKDDAKRAGVSLESGRGGIVGEGAGGAITGQRVSLDRVRLGSHSVSGMEAVVLDGANTNLLGQSFLSGYREVTVRGDVMTLKA